MTFIHQCAAGSSFSRKFKKGSSAFGRMRAFAIVLLCLLFCILALEAEESAPRWGLLGDDEGLKYKFDSCESVFLVCVTSVQLEDIKPPFAMVVQNCTVIKACKGQAEVGGRIQIRFPTDSLPIDSKKRDEFVEKASKKNEGELKFAFLYGQDEGEGGRYFTEWCNFGKYSEELDGAVDTLGE